MGPQVGLLIFLSTLPPLVLLQPYMIRAETDLFQPTTFLFLNVLLGVTLRALLIINERTRAIDDKFLLGQEYAFFFPAILWITGALVLFLIGYALNFRVPKNRIGILKGGIEKWANNKILILSIIILAIALYSIYDFVSQLNVADLQVTNFSKKRTFRIDGEKVSLGYQRWGASLANVGFYMIFIFMLLKRVRYFSVHGLFLFAFFGISALFALFTGSRVDLLFFFLNGMLIFNYLRKFRIRKFLPLILILGFLVVFMSRSRHTRTDDIDDLVGGISFYETFGSLVDNRNHLGFTKTAHIMDAVPGKMNFAYGSTMLGWLYAPIPKTYWPEKPIVLTGPLITENVYQRDWKRNGGVPPGLVADLYWNFGYLGIVLGYLIAGVFTRYMYNFFLTVKRNPNALFLYMTLLYSLVFVLHSNGVVYAITNLLQGIVPTILIIGFFSLPKIKWFG